MLLARPRHRAVSSPAAAAVMRAGSAVSSEAGPCAVSPARREVQLETLEAELRDAVEDSSRPQSTLETPMCRASPQRVPGQDMAKAKDTKPSLESDLT